MAGRRAFVSCFCVSLLFATVQQRTDAILPETSYSSQYVLMGEYTQWIINGSATNQCNYTTVLENNGRSTSGDSSAIREAGNVVFTLPGIYYHQCPVAPVTMANNSTEFRVVTAQHKVAICSSNNKITCTREMQVNVGDVVYWTTQFDNNTDCSGIVLVNAACSETSFRQYYQTATGLQEGYYFDEPGIYRLYCTSNDTELITSCNQPSTASALLTVSVKAVVKGLSYNELVYSHAGVMAVAFGLLLPVGSLLANYKLVVCHIILQISGQILSLIGFVLALVYQQLNNRPHFSQVHSIMGLCLIFMVVILQPVLKLISLKFLKKQVNVWHKRLGVASIFIGLCNIFIGMLLLDKTPLYVKILYGIWLVIIVAVFIISGAVTRNNDKQDEYEMNNGVHWKSKEDRISLSPPSTFGPSKLSKEIINERSFVQIRKKSIDVLESPFDTNIPPNSSRQRKISNVRFGEIVAEQQLSPIPPTPNNISDTNFGFGEKSKYTDESDDSNDKGEDNTDGGENSSGSSSDSCSSDSSRSPSPDEPPSAAVKKMSINKSLESISSLPSNGGSVRITRHSSRAHTKASEVFQRSNSVSRPTHLAPSISINSESPLITSPPTEYPSSSPKAVTPTSDDDQLQPKKCPFTRSAHSDSVLPLHQRRQRRTGLEMQVPKPAADNLSIGRVTPARSPSRSPSFSRKRRDMLVDNTLRSVMQMSDDAIVSANAQGELVFWSNGAMKIFGYTPGEAIGSSLQMVMPQRYKEKHQNGINRRTEFALDYIKKHNSAPEEQKHARLYAVHGVSKSGREFGVEVVVSSFVIEGEIYYTGIITETDKGLTRQLSSASLSSDAEIREKQQKAIAIGTQMKIAHKLQSAEHMTKNELQNMLDCSLKASQFEVPADDLSKMVDGILQAADREECNMITFTELIDLLAKNKLYISDSGVIAKYGKSKTEGNLSFGQQMFNKFASFFTRNISSIVWFGIYLVVSVMILLGAVLSSGREGWQSFAYDGTGSLLSFNCVLILLMSLKGFAYSLRGNVFIVRALPLHSMVSFHILFFCIVLFLSVLHVLGHFCSFAFDASTDYNETMSDRGHYFSANLEASISPLISGLLMCLVIVITTCFSLPCLRKLCKFCGFYATHWIAAVLFYLLLIIHGNKHFNVSFWKWLLPVLILFVLDRVYLLFVLKNKAVEITKAFAYDDYSRTTYIEVKKPKRFKFVPGQCVHVNIPQIGYFNWQPCHISSSNKEESIKVFLPHNGNQWLKTCYTNFKANPLNPKPKEGQTEVLMPPIDGHMRGPFGCDTQLLFNYQVAMLVCGNDGPSVARSVIQTFLEYRRSNTCHCGCHPKLTKLYFIWVIPSGNDFEWFTDYLSDIIEDKHIQRYLDIRIYLTNINSPPDELASALLQLALKTGGPALSVKRPSQPQLSKLHSNTSYGAPDFESLLDFVSMQQGTASDQEVECGVFTVGNIPYSMETSLRLSCDMCSKKRGPSTNNEMEVTSPYRRKLSIDADKSPSPLEQAPAEWHISFQLHKLLL